MSGSNKKKDKIRGKNGKYPLSPLVRQRGVELKGGVPSTPNFLIVDIEVSGDFYTTIRQRPPKKTIPYYRLIRKLRDRGYFFYEISNIFNQHNLKPNRTDKFSPQIIHGSFKKMKIREKEMSKRDKPKIVNIEYEY